MRHRRQDRLAGLGFGDQAPRQLGQVVAVGSCVAAQQLECIVDRHRTGEEPGVAAVGTRCGAVGAIADEDVADAASRSDRDTILMTATGQSDGRRSLTLGAVQLAPSNVSNSLDLCGA